MDREKPTKIAEKPLGGHQGALGEIYEATEFYLEKLWDDSAKPLRFIAKPFGNH